MKTFLQFILFAAIFYSNSNALICNQCKPTPRHPYCEEYEKKVCDSDENDYCLDIFVNSGIRKISYIEKSCVSKENFAKRCSVASDGGLCIPCNEDLCNKMTLVDFLNQY